MRRTFEEGAGKLSKMSSGKVAEAMECVTRYKAKQKA
jgi:hypothetical protein